VPDEHVFRLSVATGSPNRSLRGSSVRSANAGIRSTRSYETPCSARIPLQRDAVKRWRRRGIPWHRSRCNCPSGWNLQPAPSCNCAALRVSWTVWTALVFRTQYDWLNF